MTHWIDCQKGERYTVLSSHDGTPIEPDWGGQTGTCVGFSEGRFGRKWAELEFEDGSVETFRTLHLVKANDSSSDITTTPDD